MRKQKGFTLIELLVVIAIIAMLMAILMPALRRVREQARMAGCSANLRQWSLTLNTYCEDNDGKFLSGVNNLGHWWPCQLDEDLKNWKKNKIWFERALDLQVAQTIPDQRPLDSRRRRDTGSLARLDQALSRFLTCDVTYCQNAGAGGIARKGQQQGSQRAPVEWAS